MGHVKCDNVERISFYQLKACFGLWNEIGDYIYVDDFRMDNWTNKMIVF